MSCESEPLQVRGNPVKAFEGNSYTVTAVFLDEMTLQKRYGKKNNPFINVSHIITPRTFMVFDLIIKAKDQRLKFQLNKMELQYAAINVTPRNRFLMVEHWEFEDSYDDTVKGVDTARKVALINKTLFPDQFEVSPGSTIKGLIVFSANFPKSGTATLTIPVFESSGNLIDVAKMEYSYSLY
jgi:hypothetical protein